MQLFLAVCQSVVQRHPSDSALCLATSGLSSLGALVLMGCEEMILGSQEAGRSSESKLDPVAS